MYYIPLNLIDPNPWQTRQGEPDRSYIKELALDIAAKGLLQVPIGRLFQNGHPFDYAPFGGSIAADEMVSVLRDEPDVRVQLAFGHNRLAAFRWLHELRDNSDIQGDYSAMPVELRQLTDEQTAGYAWSENERRRDVDPISRAKAVQKRIDDFMWTQAKAAEHLGISRPAVANLLRLLKLPEETQAALAAGQLSPRQAEALLSLYALPEAVRAKGEGQWDGDVKPSRILADALAGESSENTRRRVTHLTERYAERLNNAPWSLGYVFEEHPNSHAPACNHCDARLDSGNWKYCLLPDCFRARHKVFTQDYLQRASQVCGIPALEADRDIYRTTSLYKEHAQILTGKKCENLRLIYEGNQNEMFPRPEGFPQARILCWKSSQCCTCVNGLKEMQRSGAQTRPESTLSESQAPSAPAPTPEDLEAAAHIARVAQHERRRQVVDLGRQAANLFADALDRDEPGAWRSLAGKFIGYSKQDELKSLDSSEIRRRIADKLADEHSNDYTGESRPEYALDTLNEWLHESGLPPLRYNGSDPAGALQRRLVRIEGWISNFSEYAGTAALQGNLDNLERLKKEIQDLPDDQQRSDLATRVAAGILKIDQSIAALPNKQPESESKELP